MKFLFWGFSSLEREKRGILFDDTLKKRGAITWRYTFPTTLLPLLLFHLLRLLRLLLLFIEATFRGLKSSETVLDKSQISYLFNQYITLFPYLLFLGRVNCSSLGLTCLHLNFFLYVLSLFWQNIWFAKLWTDCYFKLSLLHPPELFHPISYKFIITMLFITTWTILKYLFYLETFFNAN